MNRYKYVDDRDERGKQKHIHTLDGKPLVGTSTATKILGNQLIWWAAGKAAEVFGWTNGKYLAKNQRVVKAETRRDEIKKLSVEEYLNLLDDAYCAHNSIKEEKAVEGTDRHAMCEAWIKSVMSGNEITPDPSIQKFVDWSKKNVKRWLWSEGYCYSERLWVGGICDAGFEDINGKICVLDFKSAKSVYTSYRLQTAGYDIQISENGVLDKDGNQLLAPVSADYYAIWAFGSNADEPVIDYNVVGLRNGFESKIELYKLEQSYEVQ